MKKAFAFYLIMAATAHAGTKYETHLGATPVLAGGTYDSGGGITVAAELKNINGQTMICGAWSQSLHQSILTKRVEYRLLQTGSIHVDGRAIRRGLGFMNEVAPQSTYAGQTAHCIAPRKPVASDAKIDIRIPNQAVYRDIDMNGGIVVRYTHNGPGAGTDNVIRKWIRKSPSG